MEPKESIVYEFHKNSYEIVRAGFSKYKGSVYAYIRIFYNANYDSENPDWRPSKKGVVLKLDLLEELAKAVDSLVKGKNAYS